MHYIKVKLYVTVLSVIVICNSTSAQKILTDTILVGAGYDEYCESVMVRKLVVPDSVFTKYNGNLPDPDTEEIIKYMATWYDLGFDNTTGELYGHSDFILSIGGFQMEFSFPQYSFYLDLSELKGSDIYLVNTKNNEQINIEWISFAFFNEKKIYLKDGNEEVFNFLNSTENKKLLELEISSIKYPNNDSRCGNVIHKFPKIKVQIF